MNQMTELQDAAICVSRPSAEELERSKNHEMEGFKEQKINNISGETNNQGVIQQYLTTYEIYLYQNSSKNTRRVSSDQTPQNNCRRNSMTSVRILGIRSYLPKGIGYMAKMVQVRTKLWVRADRGSAVDCEGGTPIYTVREIKGGVEEIESINSLTLFYSKIFGAIW